MKIYLVEDTGNNPGRIYAVMSDKGDAYEFASMLESAIVVERTLFYGQPPRHGFNE